MCGWREVQATSDRRGSVPVLWSPPCLHTGIKDTQITYIEQIAPKRICKSMWNNFCLRVVSKRKISSMDLKKKRRLSVYLLMINQQGCMAAKWVFECAASFFPLSPRIVTEMEKIRH